MREIVLDTETTGLDPKSGHRIIEIGCIELVNRIPSGKVFHTYLNPEREVPIEAFQVHGLAWSFLKDFPVFSSVYKDFLVFIAEDPLVIHNAAFDLRFLNSELEKVAAPLIPSERTVDTLQIAKRKFPGSPASLDALCRRFSIDNSERDYHGALLDAELLCDIYLELLGGRQATLGLSTALTSTVSSLKPNEPKSIRPPRPHGPTAYEIRQHQEFLAKIMRHAGPR